MTSKDNVNVFHALMELEETEIESENENEINETNICLDKSTIQIKINNIYYGDSLSNDLINDLKLSIISTSSTSFHTLLV